MLLQNDQSIAKSPPIFEDYLRDAFMNSDPKSPYDSTNFSSPGRDMALQHMEQLVPKLAQNVIAIQKIVENSTLANSTGNPEDDKRLKAIRDQLLKAQALQSASLDLINGFVATEQLGDIQHAGQEFLAGIQNEDTQTKQAPQYPGFSTEQDPNSPGLPQNPYAIDVAAMPGLSIGYNPVSRIVTVLQSVRTQTAARENELASSVAAVANACGVVPSASPPP